MKKFKKSTYLPVLLALYLLVMAYIGLPILRRGDYLYYFSVFGLSLLVIVLLHFSLKRKEKLRDMRQKEHDKSRESEQKE